MKKLVSNLLIALMILSISIPTFVFADTNQSVIPTTQLKDIYGHWAEKQIKDWVTKGFIKGYGDGTFKPNASIKRNELISITNKAFGFKDSTEVNFKDVKSDDWFYNDVTKAQKAGYVSGYDDGTFKPDKNITRQEMAVVVSKLLSLIPSDSANNFSDTTNSPDWSKGSIGAVIDKGIMQGYNKGSFGPNENLTRGEAIVILDRAIQFKDLVYNVAGTFGPSTGIESVSQNVVINSSGVTLQNMTIAGNLLLAEGIGEGDVYLKNVTVKGTTTVKGGGSHSVHFENSIMVTVVVDKIDGSVRIVINGASVIKDIQVQSNVKLESNDTASINSVTLSKALPKDSQVNLVGSFETVNVLAQSIVVEIPQGSVKTLNVDKDANDTTINNEGNIVSLIMNAVTKVLGQGKVETATVNAIGISMEHQPDKVDLGKDVSKDVKMVVGGVEKTAETKTEPSPTPLQTSVSTPITNNPIPVDLTAPIISGVSNKVTVTEDAYGTSNENGFIYLVRTGTTKTLILLDLAITDIHRGKKVAVQAGVKVGINTEGLNAGRYYMAAVDAVGNISESSYLNVNAGPNDPILESGLGTSQNTLVNIVFNKDIVNNLVDISALKNSVTISTHGEANFVPLSNGDTVSIQDNQLIVTFVQPFSGSENKIKIAANAIKDIYGNILNSDSISFTFKGAPMVKLTSGATSSSISVGDSVYVQVDQPDTLYLIKQGMSGTKVDFENEVVALRAKKLEVIQSDVNKSLEFSTTGLTPGIYEIMAWGGTTIYPIEISVTPRLDVSKITITNNSAGTSDKVVVIALTVGDIVKVYDHPSGTLLGTATVANGQTTATVNIAQLGTGAGMAYITLTSIGKAESSPVGLSYAAEIGI